MSDKNYIHPAQKRQEEHEKRKEKKKKKRGLLWFLLLLLLLAALIGGIGFGQGWFDGEGEGDDGDTTKSADTSSAAESAAESSEDESSEAPKTTVTIKVSGSTYIYNNAERDLEQLKTELALLDKTAVIIEVADDNAVANAVQSLHDALTELELGYTDTVFTDSEADSAADTSSETDSSEAA